MKQVLIFILVELVFLAVFLLVARLIEHFFL